MNCHKCIHCHEHQLQFSYDEYINKWWQFPKTKRITVPYKQLVCKLNPDHVEVISGHFCSQFKEDK